MKTDEAIRHGLRQSKAVSLTSLLDELKSKDNKAWESKKSFEEWVNESVAENDDDDAEASVSPLNVVGNNDVVKPKNMKSIATLNSATGILLTIVCPTCIEYRLLLLLSAANLSHSFCFI